MSDDISKKLKLLKIKQSDLLAANEQLKRELPAILEHTKTIAAIRKASYDAHIDAGFNPEQALELCKTTLL